MCTGVLCYVKCKNYSCKTMSEPGNRLSIKYKNRFETVWDFCHFFSNLNKPKALWKKKLKPGVVSPKVCIFRWAFHHFTTRIVCVRLVVIVQNTVKFINQVSQRRIFILFWFFECRLLVNPTVFRMGGWYIYIKYSLVWWSMGIYVQFVSYILHLELAMNITSSHF